LKIVESGVKKLVEQIININLNSIVDKFP
jgi:hypothetical protein